MQSCRPASREPQTINVQSFRGVRNTGQSRKRVSRRVFFVDFAVFRGLRALYSLSDYVQAGWHSDRGCGEAESVADTGHRTEAKSSDPSGPESSIDGLERAPWLFKKGNKAGCRRYAGKAKHTAAARKIKIRNTSNPDRGLHGGPVTTLRPTSAAKAAAMIAVGRDTGFMELVASSQGGYASEKRPSRQRSESVQSSY